MTSDPASLPELRLLKGTTDQPPQRQIRRQAVIATIREVFETFGFDPLETPILAHFDQLALKYGVDDPILEEIFHVTDRGRRELGLRYDLTVPFCRFVGMALRGQFSLPFKRYEIGKVFRDGPIREGRLREFTQCDADIVGSADPAADAECLAMADLVFQRLGLETEIELNNRKILWGILEEAGLDGAKRDAATTAVDKWDKIGVEGVRKELADLGLSDSAIERIFAHLATGARGEEGLKELEDTDLRGNALFRTGLAEQRAILEAAKGFGLSAPIRLVPRLARGLGIYTGTIFEFFCRDRTLIDSSIGSGGRYDRIVGEFLHPGEPERQGDYPCVGVSFGIEPLTVALDKLRGAAAGALTVTEALIVPMGARDEALKLAGWLRRLGVRTDIDLSGGRLRKSLKRANAMGIPFLLMLGEEELAAGEVSLRDMTSGEQTRFPLTPDGADQIAARCQAARNTRGV
ncbi:MAG: histidine--tRNA ligase [Candidatus Sumerlaeota bacterium]|nr:histidine--tRNA ligase [Candidatus Sumerlaeota bacterium]